MEIIETSQVTVTPDLGEVKEYSVLLDQLGLSYTTDNFFYMVGGVPNRRGWILHLSLIKIQLAAYLPSIIEMLKDYRVPFRMVKNFNIGMAINDGNLGFTEIGKIVTVFPPMEGIAVQLAKSLVALTNGSRGPGVPGCQRLGGAVYTRLGAFTPVYLADAAHAPGTYYVGEDGQEVTDMISIPFSIPPKVEWPFAELVVPTKENNFGLMNSSYKPLYLLKDRDPKGRVIRAQYFKKFWSIKSCAIKEGVRDMFSDMKGRDIPDRLIWQAELYREIEGKVPIPHIFDLFQENENTYLAMSFIKGKFITAYLDDLYKDRSWKMLSDKEKKKVVDLLQKVWEVIQDLHRCGVVHRDITPPNFLIDKRDKIWMIDLELSYSMKKKLPGGPFGVGTRGYMSPEQEFEEDNGTEPTFKEDTYGFGGLMIDMFTHLPSIKFQKQDLPALRKSLTFVTGSVALSEIICQCFEVDPEKRPDFDKINIQVIRDEAIKNPTPYPKNIRIGEPFIDGNPSELVQRAINGLSLPMPTENRLFEDDNPYSKYLISYNKHESLFEGISGLIYLLGRAKRCSYDISANAQLIDTTWDILLNQYDSSHTDVPKGFYSGGAGVATAIIEGLNGAILDPSEQTCDLLKICLDQDDSQLNFMNGKAGIGHAILKCITGQRQEWVSQNEYLQRAEAIGEHLLGYQKANGAWDLKGERTDKHELEAGLSKGTTGIILFLLELESVSPSPFRRKAISKGIEWITSQIPKIGKNEELYIGRKSWPHPWSYNNGLAGITLVLLKGYQILGDNKALDKAIKILNGFPFESVWTDYSAARGMAGRGSLYLQAHKILDDNKWLKRAGFIVDAFSHTFGDLDSASGHWVATNELRPVGSIWTGNSGIIDFLLQFYHSSKCDNILNI